MQELPAQTVIAVATVFGALIAGLFSFVNLTLTKEQKTSEFRQAWIDALRGELAVFLSSARAAARVVSERIVLGENYKNAPLKFSDEQVGQLRVAVAEAFYKIKLRLNPKKEMHIELLRLMDVAVGVQNQMSASSPNTEAVFAAIERVADHARPLLKTEWERVKKGETPFRIARNWIAPLLIAACFGFIWFLLRTKFKI